MSDYLDYWQLVTSPYRGDAVYRSPALVEAVARIDFLSESPGRCAAVLGESGSGKSVALEEAQRALRNGRRKLLAIDAFAISQRELVEQLAQLFSGRHVPHELGSEAWRRLNDALSQQAWQGTTNVLLLDDAGDLGPDAMRGLLRLLHTARACGAQFTAVLAASETQATNWPADLREVIELRVDMYAWDEMATVDYLQHAVIDVGRTSPLFTEDAMYRIHAHTEGVPREINRLAELSLVAGAAARLPIIEAACIDGVQSQLSCALV